MTVSFSLDRWLGELDVGRPRMGAWKFLPARIGLKSGSSRGLRRRGAGSERGERRGEIRSARES